MLTQYVARLLQVLLKDMGSVVEMILTSLGDPHPRVRWAAINALGQLSTDLGPHLQKKFHARVLPALLNSMDDFQSPRVQVCESTVTNCSHTASEPDNARAGTSRVKWKHAWGYGAPAEVFKALRCKASEIFSGCAYAVAVHGFPEKGAACAQPQRCMLGGSQGDCTMPVA